MSDGNIVWGRVHSFEFVPARNFSCQGGPPWCCSVGYIPVLTGLLMWSCDYFEIRDLGLWWEKQLFILSVAGPYLITLNIWHTLYTIRPMWFNLSARKIKHRRTFYPLCMFLQVSRIYEIASFLVYGILVKCMMVDLKAIFKLGRLI